MAERLLRVERRLAVLEGLARDLSETARHIDAVTGPKLGSPNRKFLVRPAAETIGLRSARGGAKFAPAHGRRWHALAEPAKGLMRQRTE